MVEYIFAMEILKKPFVLLILHLTGVRAECQERFYKYSEQCLACALHCKFCNSNTYCFSCDDGFSGTICSQQCINCKKDNKCIKDTGICEEACKEGLAGQYCDKACDSRCRSCIKNNTKQCTSCTNGNVCEQDCQVDCYLQDCNKTCKHRCLRNCNEDMPNTEAWQVAVTDLAVLLVMTIIVQLSMFIYKRDYTQPKNKPDAKYLPTVEEADQVKI